MPEIHVQSDLTDEARRQRLYAGAIFVYRSTDTTRAFCAFADELIRSAFAGLDPETAQFELPVQRYSEILTELKPRFIHHPESKKFVTQILMEHGCDPDDTCFDVPRMRSSTSDGYLTTGIAYAWHAHRDTWYSAPACQINWWIPIYPITAGNCMAVHFDDFNKVVPNDSSTYDYAEWNKKHRYTASKHIKQDTRPLPRSLEPVDESTSTPLVCEVGGVILFSADQLHASVPNMSGKTRFSIDFRTVSVADVASRTGAPTKDVYCTGSSIRDFKRVRDLAEIPDKLAVALEEGR